MEWVRTNLSGLVFGGSDEVSTVLRELDVVDLVIKLVRLDVLQLLTSLRANQHSFPDSRCRISPPFHRIG